MARVLAVLTVLVLALPSVSPATAGEPTEQLRAQVDRAFALLEDPALRGPESAAERRRQLRRIAEQTFDFGAAARRALGRHWEGRTEGERAEFVRLFTALIDRGYLSRLDLYEGERLAWTGESMDGDDAIVKTHVVTRSGETPADFLMTRGAGGRWHVRDVVVAGVSLVGNYRTQFARILRTTSFDDLLEKLRAKQAAD
ncbi:MAG: MlaC/ttg2D family ABC transporter substrate-binding protein [Candidatus Rokuibacteriota bacterium]